MLLIVAGGNLQPYAARWNRIVKGFKQLLVPVNAGQCCLCLLTGF